MTIPKKDIEKRVENFRQVCREGGFRLTPQKVGIYRFLASTDKHPNAHEVYAEMKDIFPTISFATVYNNLNKFSEMGLVREIKGGGSAVRFDANLDHHCHMIDGTGRVVDINVDISKIPVPRELLGKKIKEIKLSYFI